MADHVVMPPVVMDGVPCGCALCLKRRFELELAEDMEWELYRKARLDIPMAKRDPVPVLAPVRRRQLDARRYAATKREKRQARRRA